MNLEKIRNYCIIGQQGFNEINELYEKFLKNSNKDLMLEIGSCYGDSAKIWEEFGFKKIILINLSFSWLKYDFDNKFSFIEGDSRSENVLNKVKDSLNGSKLDFLFIDGGHSYEEVKGDYNLYKDFVKNSGIIVLHDFELQGTGVKQFFDEIKLNYKQTFEIKNDYYGYGIIINKMENK